MKVLVVGIGYVGLSTAVALALKNEVDICDIVQTKIDDVNARISPFEDEGISDYFKLPLKLKAITTNNVNYQKYDFIIIAVPTNYRDQFGDLDTSSVEQVIDLAKDTNAIIVIRSTVPFGFTRKLNNKYKKLKILYCPEFLREGTALFDFLHPSRIVVGGDEKHAQIYMDWILESTPIEKSKVVLASYSEAEAIKLFSNSYLAMRVAFFNEIDNFALYNNISSKICIEGICMDSRIGNYYNNPSFGYGGSCLPKDTKSLKNAFLHIPNSIISAIDDSNITRKKFIANELLKEKVDIIGIYRLSAKSGSDNIREAAIMDICKILVDQGQKVIIFEPLIQEPQIYGCDIIRDFIEFKKRADLIVANRIDSLIESACDKIYTRDVFNNN